MHDVQERVNHLSNLIWAQSPGLQISAGISGNSIRICCKDNVLNIVYNVPAEWVKEDIHESLSGDISSVNAVVESTVGFFITHSQLSTFFSSISSEVEVDISMWKKNLIRFAVTSLAMGKLIFTFDINKLRGQSDENASLAAAQNLAWTLISGRYKEITGTEPTSSDDCFFSGRQK